MPITVFSVYRLCSPLIAFYNTPRQWLMYYCGPSTTHYYYYCYYYYCYFINLAFFHWQMLYRFLPIMRVITKDQRFMGLLSVFYVFKNLYFPILLHSFLENFPPPPPPPPISPHLPLFVSNPLQTRFHKPYPQSKTFLNTRAVPSSAVFCSNTVLITTPSFSMHFFSSMTCCQVPQLPPE